MTSSFSAMPLDKLCNDMLNGEVPREIKKATACLRHSGGYMVGIGIKQPCPSTKSWMYFPEDNCPFYRVTYLSNYSPYMTPDNDRVLFAAVRNQLQRVQAGGWTSDRRRYDHRA